MPRYSVRAPDGNTYSVDGPAGATDAQVRAEVLRQHPGAAGATPKRDGSLTGEIRGAMSGSVGKFKADLKDDYRKTVSTRAPANLGEAVTQQVGAMGRSARNVGNALGVLASPIAGLTEGAIVKPYGRGMSAVTGTPAEGWEGDMRLALMAARAGPARARAPLPAPRARATPVEVMGQRQRLDPAAMRARAAEFRQAGVEPTLTDVSGGRGQRFVRAVGVRSEEAGEVLTNRSTQATASTKPAAMDATRRLHNDPRTPSQYADALEATRTTDARRNYGAFDHQPVQVPETVIDMLADSSGRAIIARARREAAENQEWPRLAELDRLAQHRPGDPLPRITAGTLDKLSAAARNRGAAFSARPGGGNMARGSLGRRDQIDATMDAVPELRPARRTFSDQSRAIDVARGENYLDPLTTNPTDYAAWLHGLPAEARRANQIATRQQILDKLGKQRENTFGSLDEITSAQYSRENLRAVFGAREADAYLARIAARVQQARNASFVSPNAGSRTGVLENDVGNAAQQTVGAVRQGLSGDLIGLAARAVDAWRRRGFTPQQAEELARVASDPAQTDAAIDAIAARLAPQARGQFLTLRRAARALQGGSRPAAAGASGANLLAGPQEPQTNALLGR